MSIHGTMVLCRADLIDHETHEARPLRAFSIDITRHAVRVDPDTAGRGICNVLRDILRPRDHERFRVTLYDDESRYLGVATLDANSQGWTR